MSASLVLAGCEIRPDANGSWAVRLCGRVWWLRRAARVVSRGIGVAVAWVGVGRLGDRGMTLQLRGAHASPVSYAAVQRWHLEGGRWDS